MKKTALSLFAIIVLIFSDAKAQPIFSVQYKSEAKVKVFVAQSILQSINPKLDGKTAVKNIYFIKFILIYFQ